MLSSVYLIAQKDKLDSLSNPTLPIITDVQMQDQNQGGIIINTRRNPNTHVLRDILIGFLLILIIEISFIVYAIHCIVKCGHANNWPTFLIFTLIVLMFTPLNFILGTGIIVYHLASGCNKPKLAFTFY
jgi:hypothetical protein